MIAVNCKCVTLAQHLQTAQRLVAASEAMRGACEILEGVVRAFTGGGHTEKEPGLGL